MNLPRVLIVEKNREISKTLSEDFTREGFEVMLAVDGGEGLRKTQALLPDALIIEVDMPTMDGLSICKELRAGERGQDIPIVLMSEKAEEVDMVLGYSSGADVYITKPISSIVLIHKVQALLRRKNGMTKKTERVEHLGLKIDRIKHRVSFRTKPIEVTPTEFRLIETLLRQPGRAFSRRQLMDAAIGDGQIVLERTIDVHIKTIRKKLSAAGSNVELIETVRSVGYRLRESR